MANEDIFYLGIKILIVNREGKILLLLRPLSDEKGSEAAPSRTNESALWDIPGGRKQRGEDIAEALERELYEETGLQIGDRDVQFVGPHLSSGRIPAGETDAGLILFVYECKWDGIPKVRPSPEHCDFWWATPEEACEALRSHIPKFYSNQRENWRKALRQTRLA